VSAVAIEVPLGWPEGDLYHSARGLYPFQEESIARDYLETQDGGGKLVVWDTGTGKSHFGMRMSTLLAEDARNGVRRHDLTILLCEKGKVGEWVSDFAKYTRQDARIHLGSGRMDKIERLGLPDVLVTTYETAKIDLVKFVRQPGKGKRGTSLQPGPLMDLIADKKVLWIGDEFGAKLGNRTSDCYKAFDWVWRQMRKNHPRDHRLFGLTATPIERDWENAFNQYRLIRPDLMPTVKEFEEYFVRSRHPVYGTPRYHAERMHEFAAMGRPILDRRRKSDPDIVSQFPKKVEEAVHLEMGKDQAALYERVESLQQDQEDPVPGLWTTLRQIAGHPAALVLSAAHRDSVLAKALVAEYGAEYLSSVPSVAEQALIERLTPVVKGQGAKAVVFTFFGQSILPVLAKSLRAKKFRVYENHGGLTAAQMTQVRQDFKSDPEPAVFLTSDAGARGINLPEATYVFEFESALTYANRTQRLDRIHRIDSLSESVTCTTLVVDGTVHVPIIQKMAERNTQTDILLGDDDAGENFLSARDRMQALQIARLSRTRSRR